MFSNKRSCKRSSFKCLFDFYLFQFESFVMIQSFFFFSHSQREIPITYIFFRGSQQILQIGIERVWNLWLNHVNTFSNTNIWTLNSRNSIAMLRSNLNMKPLIVIINRHFFFFFLQKLAKILHQVREMYIIQNYYMLRCILTDRQKNRRSEC